METVQWETRDEFSGYYTSADGRFAMRRAACPRDRERPIYLHDATLCAGAMKKCLAYFATRDDAADEAIRRLSAVT